jgi:hypothetical protein
MRHVWRPIGGLVAVVVGAFGLALAARAAPAGPSALARPLGEAEAAALAGGQCHDCVDCETYSDTCAANGTNNCTSPGGSCTAGIVTGAKGSGTVRKKCTSSGSLSGDCGPEDRYDCLTDGDMCQCTANAPDWVCSRSNSLTRAITMSQDPCN